MKQFVFDRLVDRENLCNLERERQALRDAVARGYRVVVYGPRNYGKTSVVRNDHHRRVPPHPGAPLRAFADLLGVRSMQSLTRRLATSLQQSFAASFPVRSLLENASRFLGALRPEIALRPADREPEPVIAHPRRTESMPHPVRRSGITSPALRKRSTRSSCSTNSRTSRSSTRRRRNCVPGPGSARRRAHSAASVPSATCSPTCSPRRAPRWAPGVPTWSSARSPTTSITGSMERTVQPARPDDPARGGGEPAGRHAARTGSDQPAVRPVAGVAPCHRD